MVRPDFRRINSVNKTHHKHSHLLSPSLHQIRWGIPALPHKRLALLRLLVSSPMSLGTHTLVQYTLIPILSNTGSFKVKQRKLKGSAFWPRSDKIVKEWVSYGETPVTVYPKWKLFSHVKILGDFAWWSQALSRVFFQPLTFRCQCCLLQGKPKPSLPPFIRRSLACFPICKKNQLEDDF